VQVTAVGNRELPLDTLINVEWGGIQTESFQLPQATQNYDVCCQVSAEPVTGELPRVSCSTPVQLPEGGTMRAIQCTLWTGGPAFIDVKASGYVAINNQPLNTRLQENEKCGVETKPVSLTVGLPDGGI
jgi:hypothetical protein